jgi:hypothetical protein
VEASNIQFLEGKKRMFNAVLGMFCEIGTEDETYPFMLKPNCTGL